MRKIFRNINPSEWLTRSPCQSRPTWSGQCPGKLKPRSRSRRWCGAWREDSQWSESLCNHKQEAFFIFSLYLCQSLSLSLSLALSPSLSISLSCMWIKGVFLVFKPPDVGFGHQALQTITELKECVYLTREQRVITFWIISQTQSLSSRAVTNLT